MKAKKMIAALVLPVAIFISVLIGGGYLLFHVDTWLLSEIAGLSDPRG